MNIDISKHILQLLPDAYIIVNHSGQIISFNEAATDLFGYSEEEFGQLSIDSLVPQSIRGHHHKHRASYHKKPERKLMSKRESLSAVRKNGEEFPVEITLGPMEIMELRYVIAIVRDISERQHLELLQEKNNELEQFTYVASHDLQEPLRTVTSFIRVLEKELKTDDEKVQTYMRFIREASERMSGLIKGLLDYGRIGRQQNLEQINIQSMLKDIQTDLAARIQDQNAIITIGAMPTLNGYPVELRLLFQNLISNALKFQKASAQPEVEIAAIDEGTHTHFTVKDNGIGIKKEHQEKIFQIFQRLHSKNEYEGTGIGLAHCQKIVGLHHGRMWVDSTPGEGSTFHFTIIN